MTYEQGTRTYLTAVSFRARSRLVDNGMCSGISGVILCTRMVGVVCLGVRLASIATAPLGPADDVKRSDLSDQLVSACHQVLPELTALAPSRLLTGAGAAIAAAAKARRRELVKCILRSEDM
jgi:hypothetical protein